MDSAIGAPRVEPDRDADDADVPATVLCARCGKADCSGCVAVEERRVLAATPWERGQASAVRRLWQTAQVVTLDGESFFGGLGDGSVSSAFAFAITCELFAIASLAVGWLGVVYAVAPDLVVQVFGDGDARTRVALAIAAAVPALAALMVLLHVLWAGSLELGLRMQGAAPGTRHCLRYALYSCGWDLVTSPFGFVAGSVSGGVRSAARELRAAVRVPRFATRAYVRRARDLPEAKARRALALAAIVTGASVLVGALALAAALVAAMV